MSNSSSSASLSAAKLKLDIRKFLERDYETDIARLNRDLAKKSSADFSPAQPPVVFVGDPFRLTQGSSVVLIGLNPKFSKQVQPEFSALKKLVRGIRAGNHSDFDAYLERRSRYFDPDSKEYYGRYFTHLGNVIGENFLGLRRKTKKDSLFARKTFRERICSLDVLPYPSADTSKIDWTKAVDTSDDAIVEHRNLITNLIRFLRPKWIQCNGLQKRPVIENLFNAELEEQTIETKTGWTRIFSGYAHLHGEASTPIVLHPFSNSPYFSREVIACLTQRLRPRAP